MAPDAQEKLMPAIETSKWLSGYLAPLASEVTASNLEVVGALPTELTGRYIRNGPNPIGRVDAATHHWFTGNGMVHGIRLREGAAEWYRARYTRSTEVSQALAEEPRPGERHGLRDNVNTNVIGIAGRTFALVEAGARPVELDDELETIAHVDFDGTLPNGYTAHPKVDPATGDLHGIAYYWALPCLQYIVVGRDARVRSVAPIEVADGPMVHECSITERFTVVYDLPVTFDVDAAASGATFPYTWNDAHPARVGILPLGGTGDEIRWFDVGPCYVFHTLNAFDDGARVVLDLVRYERVFDRSRLGPDESEPTLWRWTIDTVTGVLTEEQLDDHGMEFPRVDERLVGRPYRWGYATEFTQRDTGNEFTGALLRWDRTKGDVERIDLGAGRISGEWVMVPRHDGVPEDDGWLLSLVYDQAEDRSELVVLPASDPGAEPVARVLLPNRVPGGFHGNWIADS